MKLLSVSTAPVFGIRSRTWPYDAKTSNLLPRYFLRVLALDGDSTISSLDIKKFLEKPHGDGGWINGGFFVLSPKVFELIEGDETYWERAPLENLAKTGNLQAFMHKGFWQPMDTIREKNHLEELWFANKAPWRIWSE